MPIQTALVALLVACHAALAVAQPPPAPPSAVFEHIQEAWRSGDADGVTRHCGEHKLSIGLPEVEPVGGRFSRSQSYYILKAYFETTRVQEFQFEHVREAEQGVRVALGLASRRYRELGDGRIIRDRVLVALAREGERWVLSEIRALR